MATQYQYAPTIGAYNPVFTVTMRTGTKDHGNGVMMPTNTIDITHYDGTVETITDIFDEDLDKETTGRYNLEVALVNATPNTVVENALIGKGYVKL